MSEETELTKTKDAPMKFEKKQTQDEKINFNDWFVITLKANKKLEAHHYDSILAYAKKQNLTETEPSSKYDDALKKFGY